MAPDTDDDIPDFAPEPPQDQLHRLAQGLLHFQLDEDHGVERVDGRQGRVYVVLVVEVVACDGVDGVLVDWVDDDHVGVGDRSVPDTAARAWLPCHQASQTSYQKEEPISESGQRGVYGGEGLDRKVCPFAKPKTAGHCWAI